MNSVYIVFPEAQKVEVKAENIGPPGPGEVLCAAEKSLISIGTETYCLRGIFDPGTNWEGWVRYPFRTGYSMAGRVIAVGKDVVGLKEGDRVCSSASHQQFFKLSAQGAILLPDSISYEDATWALLAQTTQLGVRRADLKLGESVAVVGLGMLGQLVVQYLYLSGARRIIAIDTVESRLEMARAHGATHILNMDAIRARGEVEKITRGRMLDVVFDVTGHPAVLSSCVPLVHKLGRVLLLGDTPNPNQQFLGPGVVSNSVAILGIHGTMAPAHYSEYSPWTHEAIVELFFDYIMQGRICVSDLITHRYSPNDAPAVYGNLVRDRAAHVGVIFDWSYL